MSEREIVQFIKDNGYNCYHTRRECHACPFGSNSIVKTCGCCLNKPATHDAHLKRIKLVDEYLAQFNVLENTLAVIKDMCDEFNKYHEKKELEFIAEKNRIDEEVRNIPKNFKTIDGHEIIKGVDKCYCLNVVDKFFPINDRKRIWAIDDFTNPKFKFFDDKQKADCYLALLRNKPVEWFIDNEWINVILSHPSDINRIDWVKYEYRLKPEDKFAELKEAHKNGASIEFLHDLIGQWRDVKEPSWIDDTEYRIKPEPKYQPYTKPNYDLCGTVVKKTDKDGDDYFVVIKVSSSNFYKLSDGNFNAKELFKYFKTKDGKTLGEEIK